MRFGEQGALMAYAGGAALLLCAVFVMPLSVFAQSIFDVPREMADQANDQAAHIVKKYREDIGQDDRTGLESTPDVTEPVAVALDVSVTSPDAGGRSFVVGPVFHAADRVDEAKRVVAPARPDPTMIKGLIIAPDVSFVGLSDADMFFEFVYTHLAQSVVVIGFNDLQEHFASVAAAPYVNRKITADSLQQIVTDVQASVRAAPGYERASVYVPKQNAPDGVLNIVVKRFGLGQRDLNQGRLYEAAPVALPSRRPVIPVPARKAEVPAHFAAVLEAAKAPAVSEDVPKQDDVGPFDTAVVTGLEKREDEVIPVAVSEPPDQVEPVLPTIQGFVLIVDQSFTSMEELKNFYAFNRQYTGKVIMAVGVNETYENVVTPILVQHVGKNLTDKNLDRLMQDVRTRMTALLRDQTPSYEKVRRTYDVSLPEQDYDDGVVYLIVR